MSLIWQNLSFTASEVVIATTFGQASGKNFIQMMMNLQLNFNFK